jgi:predicted phosphate transport protein (TIGR00153 family)
MALFGATPEGLIDSETFAGQKKGDGDQMGFKEWIIPQEKHFFSMLDQQADVVLEGAETLLDLVKNFDDVSRKRDVMKEIEHKGDSIVHELSEALNRTFVTPIDHDDMSKLASRLDDILDYAESAAHRMWSYEIKRIPPDMIKLVEVLVDSAKEVNHAVKDLKNFKKKNEITKHCIEINRLENIGDDITHQAVAGLFKTNEVLDIIKLKEIYEHLEMATDKCEDAADVIKDIFAKNS